MSDLNQVRVSDRHSTTHTLPNDSSKHYTSIRSDIGILHMVSASLMSGSWMDNTIYTDEVESQGESSSFIEFLMLIALVNMHTAKKMQRKW